MAGARSSHQDACLREAGASLRRRQAVRPAAQKPPKSQPPHPTVGVLGRTLPDCATATTESVVPPVMREIDTG